VKIDPTFIARVRSADSQADLHTLVQAAIELEHATIPPYLCGYFTLRLGTNAAVGDVIRTVVIEEMLHLTIASNLLIALGGSPNLKGKEFVPAYPEGLPFGIGNQPGDEFKVHLRKCTIDQVRNTFMKIEEPDEILEIPVVKGRLAALAMAGEPHFDTIGDFYRFLSQKIRDLDEEGKITWHTEGQVIPERWFQGAIRPIGSADAAAAGIHLIVDQGEGSKDDPFDELRKPSHYYRFREIAEARALIPLPGQDPPYAYAGEPVLLDTRNVWNMDDDPRVAKYRSGSTSHHMAVQFAYSYTRALSALHDAFNGGGSSKIDQAMGVMYELRLLAQQVLSTPADFADGSTNKSEIATGLCFEWQETNT
jgi:hypothetical protein